MPRKAIVLIADGIGDRPCPALSGRTPLQYAWTPNLDRMAREGIAGLLYPIRPGVVAGSDTSHLAILGSDPYEVYTGRGPFEAAGIGMEVRKGDVAFRVNFSTVSDDMTVLDRRAGRIIEGTDQLAQALDGMEIGDVKVFFKESVAHRAALVLRGPGLGANASDTDPHVTNAKVLTSTGGDEPGQKTADVVNEFVKRSYEILSQHPVNRQREAEGKLPANIALPRGIGVAPLVDPLDETWHVKSACIVETGLIAGIGSYLQMDVVDVPGATGGLDTDVAAFASTIIETLADHDFILCNIKGTDVAGHDGDPAAKATMIERVDECIGALLAGMGDDCYLMVTGDHATPCEVGDHSGDAVPICLTGPSVVADSVTAFSEADVAGGALGFIRGTDIMPIMTNLMGVQHKFGA